MEEGEGEVTILDSARDEGCPGDNGASWGELEDELGGVGEIEFGIHVDEVDKEEGREWALKILDDMGMGSTSKEG